MQVKSKSRVTDFGEVYTAAREVNNMVNLVADQVNRLDSTILEPACGNGNFCEEIIRRKLTIAKSSEEAKTAFSTMFAIDILPDNVAACRQRLYSLYTDKYGDSAEIRDILRKNIVCGNFLTGKLVVSGEETDDIWFLT